MKEKFTVVMKTGEFFKLLSDLLHKENYFIVHPLFGENFSWKLCPSFKELLRLYDETNLNCFYVGVLNTDETLDLEESDFLNTISHLVIEFTGGRYINQDIEKIEARILSKKSKVNNIFRMIVKGVAAKSDGVGVFLNDTFYKNVYYCDNVFTGCVWGNIDNKRIKILPS